MTSSRLLSYKREERLRDWTLSGQNVLLTVLLILDNSQTRLDTKKTTPNIEICSEGLRKDQLSNEHESMKDFGKGVEEHNYC